jgi:hypothetical protein
LTHSVTFEILVQATSTTRTASTTASNTTMNLTTSSSTTSAPSIPPLQVNCALSSAASGSEIAPLVQNLRTFRDQYIMKTRSGAAFMIIFNTWYYSFSPDLASYLRTHSTQRRLMTYGLYPLVTILYASYYSYVLIAPFNADAGALTAGIVAASLLGLVYIAPIGHCAKWILRRYTRSSSLNIAHVISWSGFSILMILVSYFTNSQVIGIAVSNMALSMLALGGTLGTAALSSLHVRYMSIPAVAALLRFTKSNK